MFSEVAEIVGVAQLQFQQLLKTRVILILNFTRPHAITYKNIPTLPNMVNECISKKRKLDKNFPLKPVAIKKSSSSRIRILALE